MNPVLESPPKITIGVTEACPLRCRHCYADCAHAPKAGEIDAQTWIRTLRELAGRGIIQAYFEGGEPLAKPGFLDILRAVTPLMMTLMRTHGAGLDATMAASLRQAGLGRALVDIMGSKAATHDAWTGTPGSFEEACAAVRHLVAAGIPADVLVILTRQTAPELNGILKLAHRLGAERVGVLRLYPMGRAKRDWADISLPLAEQMRAIRGLRPPEGLTVMQSWHPNDHNCCWQAAAINAFGRAIGCMYLREYVDHGDAIATPYDEIWRNNELYRQIRAGDVEERCGTCSSTQGSHGGCRSTAFAWHGRWTAPDPFDTTLNHGIDLTRLSPHILEG